jgi:hypothetical protein
MNIPGIMRIRLARRRSAIWLAFGLALMAGPLLMAAAAHADEIGIAGASGSITFTSNGNGTLSFTTAGFTATGTASFQSPSGTVVATGSASYGAMGASTGTESGGVFPITPPVTESFTYSDTSGDSLSGTITWPAIRDNTTSPSFDVNALLSIATSSGSSTFTKDFPVGGSVETDFTLSGTVTLASLAAMSAGSAATFSFSSGQVSAAPVSVVPEPSSLVLFGIGVLGFGFWARRRLLSGDLEV